MKKILFNLFFVTLFIFGSLYILFIQTEKYSSSSVVTVKNLTQEQSISALGTLLMNTASTGTQDSGILEIYIRSGDMYTLLDHDYNLSSYYASKRIDFVHRLYPDTSFPYFAANRRNFLHSYNSDLNIQYDPLSATMTISYLHADPVIAQQVVETIIHQSTQILNKFEHENTRIALEFLEKQAAKNRELFMNSIKKLIAYQNLHHTADPKADIEMESTLLATLQSELLTKEVEYKSLLVRRRSTSPAMKTLQASIREIKKKIATIKSRISGRQGKTLNVRAFDFEILENEAKLNKELYKQTLIKLEETKASIGKRAKNLTVITRPGVADTYTVPDKPKQILSLLIVLGFFYGIIYLIVSIVRSHVD